MDRKVRVQDRAPAARPRRLLLRQCPHCGGDVRLVRDIYGSYRQCFQCSREIHQDASNIPMKNLDRIAEQPVWQERLAA